MLYVVNSTCAVIPSPQHAGACDVTAHWVAQQKLHRPLILKTGVQNVLPYVKLSQESFSHTDADTYRLHYRTLITKTS